MARIRTVKPEFFQHEELQDLELAHQGKYPMGVFCGLWTLADREGRFHWKPKTIKLNILPFLPFDMSEVLDLLAEHGYLLKYQVGPSCYGAIVSWDRHQIPGRDEPPSEIPAPNGELTPYFRPPNQTQRIKVYERDKWTCLYCHKNLFDHKRMICLDHVYPYSKGGTNREQNLATCCKRCNVEKRDRTPLDAGMPWPEGLGELFNPEANAIIPINPQLTGDIVVADQEEEGENEKGNDGEQEEEGHGESIAAESVTLEAVVKDWNALPGVRKSKSVTGPIRKAVLSRIREHPDQDWWKSLFEVVSLSDFLSGRKKEWAASLDWVLGPKNLAKILNGNYDNEQFAAAGRLKNCPPPYPPKTDPIARGQWKQAYGDPKEHGYS